MSESDNSLIAEFHAHRSEAAFTALVRQHINLVFATAMRQLGDAGAAEEVTQNVFVTLAQSAGKLHSHPTIAGWLHQTTLNKSREWLRGELRRRKREQIAFNLQTVHAEGDSVWSTLVPLLDEALLQLRETDRQAVILHFMEGRTFEEVGSTLGVGGDAARKRVQRCLDQLSAFFRRKGFATPTLATGTPLFALASHSAPTHLANAVVTASLTAAHSATSTLTLIKGALKIMAWSKAKTAIFTGAVVLFAIGTTTVVVIKAVQQLREPTVDEAFWQMQTFQKAPPVLIIRPTKSAERSSFGETTAKGKALELNADLKQMLSVAYDIPVSRMVLPDNLPTNRFDLMLTLANQPREALQKELKKRFHLNANLDTHDTDGLVMTIKNANAPGLVRSNGRTQGSFAASSMSFSSRSVALSPNSPSNPQSGSVMVGGTPPPEMAARIAQLSSGNVGSGQQMTFNNQPLGIFAINLEQRLGQHVIDQTGTTNLFDIKLHVQAQPDESEQDAFKRSIREQLGLELAATNVPVEMLVVEKVK